MQIQGDSVFLLGEYGEDGLRILVAAVQRHQEVLLVRILKIIFKKLRKLLFTKRCLVVQ